MKLAGLLTKYFFPQNKPRDASWQSTYYYLKIIYMIEVNYYFFPYIIQQQTITLLFEQWYARRHYCKTMLFNEK
jgi:hypothetical protein